MIEHRFAVTAHILLWTYGHVGAQTQEYTWVAPASPDNSTTLYLGESFTITWTKNLSDSMADPTSWIDPHFADLWITGFYQHQYGHLVAEGVDVVRETESIWRVDLPYEELSATMYWAFRFFPNGASFDDLKHSISSAGFLVVNNTSTATATATTSAMSASSEIIPTSTKKPVLPAVTAPSSVESSAPLPAQLSTGAKAGIAIAVLSGAVLLLGLGWFLARCRRPSMPNNIRSHYDAVATSYLEAASLGGQKYHRQFTSPQSVPGLPSPTVSSDQKSRSSECRSVAELHA